MEKRPAGRPKRRWEDYIKIDLQGVGWGHGLDKIVCLRIGPVGGNL